MLQAALENVGIAKNRWAFAIKTRIHTHICIHTYTHTYTGCSRKRGHSQEPMGIRSKNTYIYTHTYIHTHIHTQAALENVGIAKNRWAFAVKTGNDAGSGDDLSSPALSDASADR